MDGWVDRSCFSGFALILTNVQRETCPHRFSSFFIPSFMVGVSWLFLLCLGLFPASCVSLSCTDLLSSDDIFSPIAPSRTQSYCECLAGADEPAQNATLPTLFTFPSGSGSVTAKRNVSWHLWAQYGCSLCSRTHLCFRVHCLGPLGE